MYSVYSYYSIYHPSSKGGIVFSNVCLWLTLFVCQHDISWTIIEISSQNFHSIILWSKGREARFKKGYIGVDSCCSFRHHHNIFPPSRSQWTLSQHMQVLPHVRWMDSRLDLHRCARVVRKRLCCSLVCICLRNWKVHVSEIINESINAASYWTHL